MKQYQPERLSEAQLAAMRRSLTNGRGALSRRSQLRPTGGGADTKCGIGAQKAGGKPPAQPEGAG
ncbi:spermidine/putrescine ABC transporter substrate-binding protein, partial [Streptomyces sp. NPDC058991]